MKICFAAIALIFALTVTHDAFAAETATPVKEAVAPAKKEAPVHKELPLPERPASALIQAPAITAPVKPVEPVVLPVKPITMTPPKTEEKPAKSGGLLDGLKNMFKGKDEKKPEAGKTETVKPEADTEKQAEKPADKPAAAAATKKPQSSCGSENYLGLRVLAKEEKPLPGSRKIDLSKLPSGTRVMKQGESVKEKNDPKRLNLFIDGRNVIAEAFCG